MNMTVWVFFKTHSFEVPESKFKHINDFLQNLLSRMFSGQYNVISCFVTVFSSITDVIYNLYLAYLIHVGLIFPLICIFKCKDIDKLLQL